MSVALETVRITGRYVGMDGQPCSGTITFMPPCIVRDNAGQAIVSGPITADLDYLGFLDVELPCTDQDTMDPTGWTYQVTERLDCADCLIQYRISVPCEDSPSPVPKAATVCVADGEGYTIRVTVENAIWPVTVDWGDDTSPEVFSRGQAITHTYWHDDLPLDPTRPAQPLLPAPAILSQSAAQQQAAWDPVTGDWYATEVVAGGQILEGESEAASGTQRRCAGDLAIDRVTADGQLVSHMFARKFDHGSGLGLQQDGDTVYLWTGTDAQPCAEGDGKMGFATKIGRFPYAADEVLDVGDDGLEVFDPFPQYSNVTPSLDATHGTIGIRYYTAGTPRNKFTVWTIEDFLARDFSRPVYDVAAPYHPQAQAWTLYGRYTYAFHGGTDQPLYFYVLDLATGVESGPYPNDQYPDFEHREAESITVRETAEGPQLVWGLSVSVDGVLGMALFAGEPHRTVQDVTITVTDAAGTSVTATGVDHIPCTSTE